MCGAEPARRLRSGTDLGQVLQHALDQTARPAAHDESTGALRPAFTPCRREGRRCFHSDCIGIESADIEGLVVVQGVAPGWVPAAACPPPAAVRGYRYPP